MDGTSPSPHLILLLINTELLYDRAALLVQHRETTRPSTNSTIRRANSNRHPLEARSLLPLRRLAHNRVLPLPLHKTLQTPQPRDPQPLLRYNKIHTYEIPLHTTPLSSHGRLRSRLLLRVLHLTVKPAP